MSNLGADLSALRRQLRALPRDSFRRRRAAIGLLPDAALPTRLGDVAGMDHHLQTTAQTSRFSMNSPGFSAGHVSEKFYDGFDVDSRNCRAAVPAAMPSLPSSMDCLAAPIRRGEHRRREPWSANPSISSSDCFGTSTKAWTTLSSSPTKDGGGASVWTGARRLEPTSSAFSATSQLAQSVDQVVGNSSMRSRPVSGNCSACGERCASRCA